MISKRLCKKNDKNPRVYDKLQLPDEIKHFYDKVNLIPKSFVNS